MESIQTTFFRAVAILKITTLQIAINAWICNIAINITEINRVFLCLLDLILFG
jgi:hypothetical protein